MPEWLAVMLLGVIEGVTEFLPISSTGHLLLVENSQLLPRQSDLFNITIQSGAALAVLVVFGGRLRDLLGRISEPAAGGYLAKLLLAFVITGVGGLAIKRLGFVLPKEVAPIAWATLIGGVVILLVEWGLRGRSARPSSRSWSGCQPCSRRAASRRCRPSAIRRRGRPPSGACWRWARSSRR